MAQFEDDFVSDILDTQEEAMKSLFDKPTNVDMTTPADELQVSGLRLQPPTYRPTQDVPPGVVGGVVQVT